MNPQTNTGLSGPFIVTVDGVPWRVRRAWPAGRDRIAIEAEHVDEAVGADGLEIRAGYCDLASFGAGSAGGGHETMLHAGEDPKLPGLGRLLSTVRGNRGNRLISHRPGKRAVIRLADGSFAKCVRAGKARSIVDGQLRAVAFERGFTLPRILSVDESTVVLSRLPGVELHDPTRLGGVWRRAWTESLEAWARAGEPAVIGTETGTDTGTGTRTGTGAEAAVPQSMIPVHTPSSELKVLEEWRERSRDFLGSHLSEVDTLIAEVGAQLLGRPTDAGDDAKDTATSAGANSWGPIHRDLHDKQLMWDPVAGPGLLDVDTACLGERELDLGNLAAHAFWRTIQGIWTRDDAEVVIREIDRVTSANGLDPARVRTYERSALVRLACVYAFRPQWSGRTDALLAAARR